MSGIGSLNENALHRALKQYLAPPGSSFEVEVGGYVVDIVAPDRLIEVQTSSAGKLRHKLGALLPEHTVRLAIPVAGCRWIIKSSPGERPQRRRSPKHAGLLDVFDALVYLPDLLTHPNFEVEVVITEESETRMHVPGAAWRRRGWVTTGRDLLAVRERRLLERPEDVLALLPSALPAEFTTRDLSRVAGIPLRLAQRTVYCLVRLSLARPVGRTGRLRSYAVVTAAAG